MRRAVLLWFMVLSLLVAAPGLARGQLQDVTQTGNLTATATAAACVNGTSCVQVSLQGLATVGVTLSGTWVGTITPEISIDGGTTWTATNFYNVNTQATVATVTANGQYRIVDTAGAGLARVRVSAYTSGTVVVTLRVTVATAGGAGRVTGSGTATKLAVWTSGTALGDYAGATSCTNQFMTGLSAAGASTCTSPTLAGAQFVNQGTTTTLLHGNALGNPSWSAVSLTADVTGTLPLANGGTNATTFTTSNGIVKYDGTRLVTGLLTDNGTTVAGPAGTTLALAATAPAQAAGATAGTAATYTAGNATAGASVAGAAAGGSVTITAGNAARLTSGNANGGDIALVPGAGIGTGLSGNVTLSSGQYLGPNGSSAAPTYSFANFPNYGPYASANQLFLTVAGADGMRVSSAGDVVISRDVYLGATSALSTTDTILARAASANLRLGAAAANPPVAQTLSTQPASGTDIAGANFTVDVSTGTGTGAGGSFIVRTAAAGGVSGSTAGTLAAALTIDSTKLATFAGNVTLSGSAAVVTTGASGEYRWSGQTRLVNQADGLLQISNSGLTDFSAIILGSNDTSGVRLVKTGTVVTFALGGGTSAAKFGYGAGGTVTQLTSKATGATLNATTGEITTAADALAANTTVSFVLTNSLIGVGDYVLVQHVSGGTVGSYKTEGVAGAGSATITLRNITAGSLSEAIVIKFFVLKSATT